jgi:hypothetical protein
MRGFRGAYFTLAQIIRAGLGIATIDANTRLFTATTMEDFGEAAIDPPMADVPCTALSH